jgi:peptide/nickel transport system substrate-binding protein
MAREYWDRYWAAKRSRRGFLGTAGVVGAGAAGLALVGCGDDDDKSSATNTPAAAGSATKPAGSPAASATAADPFANATRGGTLNLIDTGNPPSIDPYGNGSFHTKVHSAFVYSRMYKYNAGPGVKITDLHPVPDLASGAETSPDGMTVTMKIRPDAKFHNVAPVNGRAVDTDDIKFSWSRVQDPKTGVAARVPFIDSVTFPDKQTVVWKLKTPYAAFLDAMADTNIFFVMPKEADASASGFDPAKTMIGSGPWMFDSYTPDVSIKYKKNPDWWVKGFPLMDNANWSIIPAYANQLAQFKAGNLDIAGITADDIIDVKNTVKGSQLFGEVSQLLSFLYMDSDPNSPWNKDDRVRQAMSMALDRDGLTELGYQLKKLQDAGIAVKGNWNNIIPAGLVKYWLDPKSADMGDGAKNFKFDPTTAKQLLSAAGFPTSTKFKYQYTANAYGQTFNSIAEAQIQMLNQIGVQTTTEVQDYASKYKTQTFDKGDFSGIAFGYETPFPEAGGYQAMFLPGAPNNHSKINDPKMTELWNKQAVELDAAKRKDLFNQIQIYHGTKMYYIPSQAGAGTGWTAYSAALQVNDIHTVPGSYAVGTETYPYYWKKTS